MSIVGAPPSRAPRYGTIAFSTGQNAVKTKNGEELTLDSLRAWLASGNESQPPPVPLNGASKINKTFNKKGTKLNKADIDADVADFFTVISEFWNGDSFDPLKYLDEGSDEEKASNQYDVLSRFLKVAGSASDPNLPTLVDAFDAWRADESNFEDAVEGSVQSITDDELEETLKIIQENNGTSEEQKEKLEALREAQQNFKKHPQSRAASLVSILKQQSDAVEQLDAAASAFSSGHDEDKSRGSIMTLTRVIKRLNVEIEREYKHILEAIKLAEENTGKIRALLSRKEASV